MGGIKLTIHQNAGFDWKPLADVAPGGLTIKAAVGDNGQPEQTMALVFTDMDDGERHVYVFTGDARAKLMEKLAGGIIVPTPQPNLRKLPPP